MDNLIMDGKYPVRETVYGSDGWPAGYSHVYSNREIIDRVKRSVPPCGCSGPCDLPECDGFGNISALSGKKSPAEQAKAKVKSCSVACSPSDYYEGGKCHQHGCYVVKPRYKIHWAPKLNRVSHIVQGVEGVRIYMKSGKVIKHSYAK